DAIGRIADAVRSARDRAEPQPPPRIAARKQPFAWRVRTPDDAAEATAIDRYTAAHAPESAALIRDLFADARHEIAAAAGTERTTWLQVLTLGDVAIVGAPA